MLSLALTLSLALPASAGALRARAHDAWKHYTTLTLDLLMQKLKEMPKLPAKGLACSSTVVRALQWLSMHDESPLCEFDSQHARSSM